MSLAVNVLCRNPDEDRVIPRFARYLRDRLGWTLTAKPVPSADVFYLSGYFESGLLKETPGATRKPVAAYFTHIEEEPPGNMKRPLFLDVASQVDLRIATCRMYAELLEVWGPTVQINPPVERERFVIPPSKGKVGSRPLVAGFSGYTYGNGRKGEDLASKLLYATQSMVGKKKLEWRASGRGWPVRTKRYSWEEMPGFYQGLDVLVVTSLVEGVPMPPLEALACGVSVVVPRRVGLLDELPDTDGIYRYERGDALDLERAFREAYEARGRVDRKALRAVTEPYTIEAWCEGHRIAFYETLAIGYYPIPIEDVTPEKREPATYAVSTETPSETRQLAGSRGIYCVAFGEPARGCARRLMESVKLHLPEIPFALCAASPLGIEDLFIEQPDSDVGGRRAKLRAYELTPPEWTAVLYLDADTQVVGDIRFYFELIEDGWEFVICNDPPGRATMHSFQRTNNRQEMVETEQEIFTLHTLQWNGGVWAFGRNERVRSFFERWQGEWERHGQRDQGALIRAMYADPLKIYVLGNEWNTFAKYNDDVVTAGLRHFPGAARRWEGQLPGRLDSAGAWTRVQAFEGRRGRR